MKQEFDVLIEQDSEGFYVASAPALRGCHTQAKLLDELMVWVQEAIEVCLEETNADYPQLFSTGKPCFFHAVKPPSRCATLL